MKKKQIEYGVIYIVDGTEYGPFKKSQTTKKECRRLGRLKGVKIKVVELAV